MDMGTLVETLAAAVKGGIMTPNAAMAKLNQPPVDGGDTVYLQQQNYSLSALAKRDAKEDPFATGNTSAPVEAEASADPAEEEPSEEEIQDTAKMFALLVEKGLNLEHA